MFFYEEERERKEKEMSRTQRRAFAVSLLCGFLGVLIAIALQLMYAGGILVDEFITGTITLREVQFVVVFMWILIGIGVSAIEG